MESSRMMSWTQLGFVTSFAWFSLVSLADGAPLEVLSAPNLLRVETTEIIFVEVQDYVQEDAIPVQIKAMNYPMKTKTLASTSVTLNKANNFQSFGKIQIEATDFSKDPNRKQFVYLQAQFPNKLLEKIVLVSFQSGYIFIQTDKSIYSPNSNVMYRIFAVSPGMEPQTNAVVDTEIVTPEGVTVQSDWNTLRAGLGYSSYRLPEVVSFGVWKIVAKFRKTPQESFTFEFEVKEYVLHSFEVTLTPGSPFFYVDSEDLTVNIKAISNFGEAVDGTAYVLFGVVQDGRKKSFPDSLQKIKILEGDGVARLTREQITQTFPNIAELVGSSIFVAVSVLTKNGAEMVESELGGIKIASYPYTILFRRTPKFFKPCMPLDVTVEVVNPDDSPAPGVTVVVDPGNMEAVTSENGIARFSINSFQSSQAVFIGAKTKDPKIPAMRQAFASMTARPYKTKSNSYLYMSLDSAEVELGGTIKVDLFVGRQEREHRYITYLILSRGQLVKHGRYQMSGQMLMRQSLPVTKEMLPSFRIIAYYHPNSEEVVADSVWVDVKDSCMGSLSLKPVRPAAFYAYRSSFSLKITADPEATVGLVAIDKSVSALNRKHRLTQKKIWDMVEEYDPGCTAGGGEDGMHVFYDAGLLMETGTVPGTPSRTDFQCPTSSRRKRATTLRHNASRADSDFFREIHLLRRNRRRAQQTSVEAGGITGSDLTVVRTRLPESWLWHDVKTNACPSNIPGCSSTSHEKTFFLQDTITTWQLTGISLSDTHGICVTDPLEVLVKKTFFIDLRLPYSAVHGEQLEIKAVLYNYNPNPITAYVDLMEENNLCSAAYRRLSYRQEVPVAAQTSQLVSFVIEPLKTGHFSVEVKASVKDSSLEDAVRKTLTVLPAGQLVKLVEIVTLNPSKNGINGKESVTISGKILPSDVAPNTPMKTCMYLTGTGKMNPFQENIISGESLRGFFREPQGSGEQTMMTMTLSVAATMYLDNTNQWEAVGLEKRAEALQHLKNGYQRELIFRKSDGSFAAFPPTPSSTWLTAYVAKVFSIMSNMIDVDSANICGAVKFLILTTQQPTGVFREVGRVFHTEMMGDVAGTDSDASTTAFCLIAIQEARRICAESVPSMTQSIVRAAAYLEQRLPALTNPYAVAITSFALATEDKLNKETLFKFASPDRSHWPVPRGNTHTLEATGYALLALLKAEAIDEAHPVVRWIRKQPNLNGGYLSTQRTMIVYQAVAQYWNRVQNVDYDLKVELILPGRARPETYHFNKDNYYFTRTSKVHTVDKDITVIASGAGEAILRILSLYYTLPKEPESSCEAFDMSVQLVPEKITEDEKVYRLRIQVRFKNRDRDASLSIVDVDLPSGFTFNKPDLDALSTGRSPVISKYDAQTFLSERGSLTLYLDKISHTQQEEISFRIHQEMKTGILQPAAVKVYEYYNQKPCVKSYGPETTGSLSKLCLNGHCVCAEEMCNGQKKGKVNDNERLGKICDSTINFIYKVRVQELVDRPSADVYTLQILEVIKEVNLDVEAQGKQRKFLGKKACRDALDLQTGKTYLIMGSSRDINNDELNMSRWYTLGGNTWIEYWPLVMECQLEAHRPVCMCLEEMVDQFTAFGCFE
ncbi:complement C3-like isoform X1 [Poecilia latipinna]|uniref:complement C3-like isoform X1 n=1 Tax=Poecilia latipinna TaxID=48699 RepID=UPI00072E1EFE|nr:PREDICTED: complement C3-like isoform X1 [Poecilia latipinna]